MSGVEGLLGQSKNGVGTVAGRSGQGSKNSDDATTQELSSDSLSSAGVESQSGTVRDGGLPTKLVNTDFSYPGTSMFTWMGGWTSISRKHNLVLGTYGSSQYMWYTLPASFDSAQFGWDSTQVSQAGWSAGPAEYLSSLEQLEDAVELQRESNGNIYAELAASQAGTGIYQDIATVPGTLYTWSLKHASRDSSYLDKLSVQIGAPGQETAQQATRTVANGKGGDVVGPVGTVIATKVTNAAAGDHAGQWETYTGSYTVPAGQTVTRFTFKNIDSILPNNGNHLDDITFATSHPLTYNANGGVGSLPSQVAGTGTSGCFTHYQDGSSFSLATAGKDSDCWDSSMLTKPGARFLGWSDTPLGVVDTAADWSVARSHMKSTMTMASPGVTVYAVWGSDKTLSFDVNAPAGHAAPAAPAGQTVGFNLGTSDRSGWMVGDTGKVPGYRFLGWKISKVGPVRPSYAGVAYADPQGESEAAAYDFTSPVVADTVVYAQWEADPQAVSYDENGGQGDGNRYSSKGSTDQTVKVAGDTWFTRKEYAFTGWNTKPDGSGDTYRPGDLVKLPVGGITLYAQWERVLYSLGYDVNGGGGQVPVLSGDAPVSSASSGLTAGCFARYPSGAVIKLATADQDADCWDSSMVSRTGARFLGWADSPVGFVDNAAKWSDARSHVKTQVTMASPGITVYAVWGSDKTLSFDVNAPAGHAAPAAPASQTVGFNLGTSDRSGWMVGDTGKVSGYRFTGWKTAKSGASGSFDGDTAYVFSAPVLANTVVYAGWQPLAADISYDPNPGDGVVTGATAATAGVTDGSAMVADNGFARRGFRFNGWNTKADGTGTTYWPNQSYDKLPVGGVILYAQWATVEYALPFTGGQGVAVSVLVAVVLLGAASLFRWWRNRRMAQ